MKLNEVSEEMIKEMRSLGSTEKLQKYINDNMIELTPDQLEEISGGGDPNYPEYCPKKPYQHCDFYYTGKTKPGLIFGDLWLNYEEKCRDCGRTIWNMWGC